MEQFIDMLCSASGNNGTGCAMRTDDVRRIVYEYRMIANPAEAKSYIRNSERKSKSKMDVLFYQICKYLISIDQPAYARTALKEHGVNTDRMNDDRLKDHVVSSLNRAKFTLSRLEEGREKEAGTVDDIRRSFDKQTAAMMSHYRFQIDIGSIRASEYAHLVARFNREIKVRMAKLKKK